MKNRIWLFIIFVAFVISIAYWILIIQHENPYEANLKIFISFFATLFIWLASFFTLIFYYGKGWLGKVPPKFWQSLRLGLFTTVIITGILIMQVLKVLTWWDTGLLILAMIMLEIFFRR